MLLLRLNVDIWGACRTDATSSLALGSESSDDEDTPSGETGRRDAAASGARG